MKRFLKIKLNRFNPQNSAPFSRVIRDEKGIAMVVVLSIMFVVATFATALFTYSYNDLNFLKNDIAIEQAGYLARTGVEAAIKAYPMAPTVIKDKDGGGGGLARLYLMKDGRHLMEDDEDFDSAEVKGYVDVEITHGQEAVTLYAGEDPSMIDVVSFKGTAKIGNITQTAEAVTMSSVNGYEMGWYNSSGLIASPTGDQSSAADFQVNGIFTGTNSSTIKANYFMGSVKAPAPSAGVRLTLPEDNSKNKVAWISQNLSVDMPIDLTVTNNARQKIMVLCGRNVDLKGEITLYTGAYALMQRLGTVILNVSPDVAYIIDGKEYGKVFFQSDVYINVGRLFLSPVRYKIFSAGSAYYFRRTSASGLNGIDLLKYYSDVKGQVSTGNTLVDIVNNISGAYTNKKYVADDMLEIHNLLEKVPPNPDTITTVVWK